MGEKYSPFKSDIASALRTMCNIDQAIRQSNTKTKFRSQKALFLVRFFNRLGLGHVSVYQVADFCRPYSGEIQDLSSINVWHYIGTNDNPTNIISRGCSAKEIINDSLWWHGPHWLIKNIECWPKMNCKLEFTGISEEKGTNKTATFLIQLVIDESVIKKKLFME